MEITQTPSTPSVVASQNESAGTTISSDFDTFLKMLTVQMENQDPLNPTDSSEFALQLATFSGVEQQVQTNDLLNALMLQMNTTGMAQMADWVGREARAAVPVQFDGTPVTISPQPSAAAEKVELIVRNQSGEEIDRLVIPKSSDPIEWAGVASDGSPLPNGIYSFHVVSYAGGEEILNEPAAVYAEVSEVRSERGENILIMKGGVSVPASEVTALRG